MCQSCYEDHYSRCECCDEIVYNNDTYYSDDYCYCFDCYQKKHSNIHSYYGKGIDISATPCHPIGDTEKAAI